LATAAIITTTAPLIATAATGLGITPPSISDILAFKRNHDPPRKRSKTSSCSLPPSSTGSPDVATAQIQINVPTSTLLPSPLTTIASVTLPSAGYPIYPPPPFPAILGRNNSSNDNLIQNEEDFNKRVETLNPGVAHQENTPNPPASTTSSTIGNTTVNNFQSIPPHGISIHTTSGLNIVHPVPLGHVTFSSASTRPSPSPLNGSSLPQIPHPSTLPHPSTMALHLPAGVNTITVDPATLMGYFHANGYPVTLRQPQVLPSNGQAPLSSIGMAPYPQHILRRGGCIPYIMGPPPHPGIPPYTEVQMPSGPRGTAVAMPNGSSPILTQGSPPVNNLAQMRPPLTTTVCLNGYPSIRVENPPPSLLQHQRKQKQRPLHHPSGNINVVGGISTAPVMHPTNNHHTIAHTKSLGRPSRPIKVSNATTTSNNTTPSTLISSSISSSSSCAVPSKPVEDPLTILSTIADSLTQPKVDFVPVSLSSTIDSTSESTVSNQPNIVVSSTVETPTTTTTIATSQSINFPSTVYTFPSPPSTVNPTIATSMSAIPNESIPSRTVEELSIMTTKDTSDIPVITSLPLEEFLPCSKDKPEVAVVDN